MSQYSNTLIAARQPMAHCDYLLWSNSSSDKNCAVICNSGPFWFAGTLPSTVTSVDHIFVQSTWNMCTAQSFCFQTCNWGVLFWTVPSPDCNGHGMACSASCLSGILWDIFVWLRLTAGPSIINFKSSLFMILLLAFFSARIFKGPDSHPLAVYMWGQGSTVDEHHLCSRPLGLSEKFRALWLYSV